MLCSPPGHTNHGAVRIGRGAVPHQCPIGAPLVPHARTLLWTRWVGLVLCRSQCFHAVASISKTCNFLSG